MTLNSYYKFKRTTGKSRFDCIESTGDYLHFETVLLNKIKFNIGGLSLNLTAVSEHINNEKHRADQVISRGIHISKLFLFDISKPTVFYGDANDTSDALVMVVSADTLEVFVAKGLKNIQSDVCYEFSSGGLDGEIEALKARVKTFDLPPMG